MLSATKVHAAEADDLTAFKRAVWSPYRHAAHLQLIDEALAGVARYIETGGAAGISRLAIFVPPRYGKSQTVARLFPAWFVGRNPDRRVILTGYAASLVDKHSRAVRNIVMGDAFKRIYPGVRVADDSAARSSWDIAGCEGGMDAVGIAGAVTGKGASLLVIDDPVKNRKDAESGLIRQRVWDSYSNDLYTRLEPDGAIALIMTRWHEDDLAGRLLRDQGDEWHVIRLPALAEDGDALDRAPGAPLWAERYSADQVAKIRATLGEYSFSALYQQRPRPHDGALFKFDWIESARVQSAPERFASLVVAVDPAGTEGGDETGIIVCGMAYVGRERHGYVLDDGSLHASPSAWGRRAVALLRQYNAQAIVVEVNQGGDMATHVLKTVDAQVRVRTVRAAEGKAARAEPIAALYEQGKIHHVGEFPALEDQLIGWTPGSGRSPDRLDALVWGLSSTMLTPGGVLIR
jgi:hypothetical protein